ncbi:hypothetical protein BH10BAC2_BH10BAC2_21590 [soil metagenome]
MKLVFIFVCLLFFHFCNGKNSNQRKIDTIRKDFCNCLTQIDKAPDSARIDFCIQKYFIDTLQKIKTERRANEFMQTQDLRLQQECKAYYDYVKSTDTSEQHFASVDSFPESTVPAAVCRNAIKESGLYYLENGGSKTTVTVTDSSWVEYLRNGKYYSKLSLKWTGDCEFVITFIESNDPVKSRLSKKDESYTYRIIEVTETYCLLAVTYNGINSTFKIYRTVKAG